MFLQTITLRLVVFSSALLVAGVAPLVAAPWAPLQTLFGGPQAAAPMVGPDGVVYLDGMGPGAHQSGYGQPAYGMTGYGVPGGVVADQSNGWIGACPPEAFGYYGDGVYGVTDQSCPPQQQVVPMQQIQPAVSRQGAAIRVFGDFLYLRPSDAASTSFALPINGAIAPVNPPIPLGSVAAIDPGFDPGFRAGFGLVTDQLTEWAVSYSRLESSDGATVSVNPAGNIVLQSLVLHPSTANAATNFLSATATGGTDFQLIDGDLRRLVIRNQWLQLKYLLGARYAMLDQSLSSSFTSVASIESVSSVVDFEGAGFRIGAEGEVFSSRTNLIFYSNVVASLLAGEFNASYRQTNNILGAQAVSVWEDDRIVPVLDLELGVGWQLPGGIFRLSGGYLVSAWFNTVSNEEFIRSVQTGAYLDADDILIFDGLVARAEAQF